MPHRKVLESNLADNRGDALLWFVRSLHLHSDFDELVRSGDEDLDQASANASDEFEVGR